MFETLLYAPLWRQPVHLLITPSKHNNRMLPHSGQDETPTTDGPHQAAMAWLHTFDLTPCCWTFAACAASEHSEHPGDKSTGFAESHAHLCVWARHVVLLRASPGAAPLQLISDQALVAVRIEGNSTHNQVQASLISGKETHGKDLYNADSTCHCSISSQACVRAPA
jgi:hypothetical protein